MMYYIRFNAGKFDNSSLGIFQQEHYKSKLLYIYGYVLRIERKGLLFSLLSAYIYFTFFLSPVLAARRVVVLLVMCVCVCVVVVPPSFGWLGFSAAPPPSIPISFCAENGRKHFSVELNFRERDSPFYVSAHFDFHFLIIVVVAEKLTCTSATPFRKGNNTKQAAFAWLESNSVASFTTGWNCVLPYSYESSFKAFLVHMEYQYSSVIKPNCTVL